MSINHPLPEHVSFEPEEVKVLLTAFDAALPSWGLRDLILRPSWSRSGSWPLRGGVSVTLPDCERMPSRACGNS
jgi:hypothetical protein